MPDEISEHVERHLNDVFGISFRSVGLRLPSKTAWDSASNAFDAQGLIRNLNSDSLTFCMWLIAHPIVVEGKSAYGYAEPLKGAIISSTKMATRTLVAKEVVYFVGIALGLVNCKNDCVMDETDSFEKLVQKPSVLCKSCNMRFQKLKFRYM
ncbi:MAG: hypothetical protein ACTSQF_05600 [Candidatus Heimdallarchaeaceae archaeon]